MKEKVYLFSKNSLKWHFATILFKGYLYDTHMIFCKAHMIQKRLSDFCTTENNIKSCFDNLYFNKALLDSNNPIQKSNSCMKTIAFQGLFIL